MPDKKFVYTLTPGSVYPWVHYTLTNPVEPVIHADSLEEAIELANEAFPITTEGLEYRVKAVHN